ncbi:hypothetical protein AURDEDRAFT_166625 [Auricularia subglabra TFB-10046 SS5]|nr:hypothetical protein AURDEDRAFT_166625 [Auricularia subglabra TFB-10046 SS5]
MPIRQAPSYIGNAKTVASGVLPGLWDGIATWKLEKHGLSVAGAISAMPSQVTREEQTLYGPCTRLLNTISAAYYYLAGETYPHIRPIVFHSNPTEVIPGDYLGAQQKPDTGSGIGTRAQLIAAAKGAGVLTWTGRPWSLHASVGQVKVELDLWIGQFGSYAANLKRYRPDLATVHAFRISKAAGEGSHAYEIVLASINACGLTLSTPDVITGLDAWIAHVVLVYHSDATRNTSLTFAASQRLFSRWEVQLGNRRVLALAPFYVAPPPGRVTFATFVVGEVSLPNADALALKGRFGDDETVGFVKFSWQSKDAVWKEENLLNHLHKDGWLPGLVRNHHSRLVDPGLTVEQVGLADRPRRVFEMLHLGSIGEPLSQCQDPMEILMAAYDILETSANMMELDIIHRDLSWFNVLIKPRHDPRLMPGRVALDKPCIASILGVGQGPSALITDLDHNPMEILMAAYDILETSANMMELDIIHRDLSWFNVLIKPRHDPRLMPGRVALDKPCIASILGVGQGPSALITDLDHSAILSELLARSGTAIKEKTGTPMFRSLELFCPSELRVTFNTDQITFSVLVEAFEAIERPEYRGFLMRAFPGDNLDFAARFKVIVSKETERRALVRRKIMKPYIPPDVPHAPRHDAESVYWVLLWALGRALPQGEPDEMTSNFNNFCVDMLGEGAGIPSNGNRKQYFDTRLLSDLLHPSLEAFETVLQRMALYFSIPWELYNVGRDHAHIAMRRLLLLELLDRGDDLRIKLNTEHPRRCNVFSRETLKRSLPATALSNTGDTSSVTIELPVQESVPVVAGVKRPRNRDGVDVDGGNGSGLSSQPVAKRHQAVPHGDADGDSCDEYSERAHAAFQDHYTEKEHLESRTAKSLMLKTWKDRLLWFGSGY